MLLFSMALAGAAANRSAIAQAMAMDVAEHDKMQVPNARSRRAEKVSYRRDTVDFTTLGAGK